MNKGELIVEISSKTGLNKKQVNETLDVIMDSVTSELSIGNKVNIVGFGYFEAVRRAPKIGRNPKTGVEVPIPTAINPKFRFSKLFKNSIQ